jgi:glycosyltransferase involved in cell wall biosynthesis
MPSSRSEVRVGRRSDDRELGGPSSAGTVTVDVVVAVATYLRPDDLRRCVESVLASRSQFLQEDTRYAVRVLVIDNDPLASAREVMAAHGDASVTYLLESTPGISAARNRALAEAVGDDLLIFLDDDEVVGVDWLGHLLKTYETWHPAAVAGRVVSVFPHEPEAWFLAGGFFRRRSLSTGTPITVAATNNLLLDLAVVRNLGLRFDDYYGLIGGSDHHFTRELARHGQLMVWCNEAVATDRVPATRLTREWVLMRARRTGNSEVVVDLRLADSSWCRVRARLRWSVAGALRICAGATAVTIGGAIRSLPYQAKGAKALHRGFGMVMGALDRKVAEYRRPSATCPNAVRVLASFPEPRPTTNPYITQLADALDRVPGITLLRFSWRSAFLNSYDLVHVHWPEVLVEPRAPVTTGGRRLLFAILLLRWRLQGIPVVRTLHNRAPHERLGTVQRLLLRQLDALTVRRIALNATDVNGPDTALIPHGHYRDVFAAVSIPTSVPGRVVFAGLIRRYKNIPGLIAAFRAIDGTTASLRIAGSVADERLAEEIRAAAACDERISAELRFLSSEELAREVGEAQLVVLPYGEMHNSGAALLALSLGRPVLVPDNDVNRALAEEVGASWVRRYSGELDSGDIENALDATRALAAAAKPDLSRRSWTNVGEEHLRVYLAATRARG